MTPSPRFGRQPCRQLQATIDDNVHYENKQTHAFPLFVFEGKTSTLITREKPPLELTPKPDTGSLSGLAGGTDVWTMFTKIKSSLTLHTISLLLLHVLIVRYQSLSRFLHRKAGQRFLSSHWHPPPRARRSAVAASTPTPRIPRLAQHSARLSESLYPSFIPLLG